MHAREWTPSDVQVLPVIVPFNLDSTILSEADLAVDPGSRLCTQRSIALKRLIAKLVTAGLLSSGAVFVAASPSSAARDNPCMDAANYLSALGWFQDSAYDFLYILAAWETADHYYLPSGQEVWSADVSGAGNYQQVYTLSDYNYKVSRAHYNADNAQNNIAIFMDSNSVCA